MRSAQRGKSDHRGVLAHGRVLRDEELKGRRHRGGSACVPGHGASKQCRIAKTVDACDGCVTRERAHLVVGEGRSPAQSF